MKLATAAEVAQQAQKDAAPAATPKPAPVSHDKLRVSAKLVALVTPFMASNDIRYYLNGISIRAHPDGGAVICATNGHAMAVVHDKAGVCENDVILRIDSRTKAALKAHSSIERELVLLHGRVAVVSGGAEISLQPGEPLIEGLFPQYQKVIPKSDRLQPGLVGDFDSALLELVNESAVIAAPKSRTNRAVTFYTLDGKPETSSVARLAAEPSFIVVILPMRGCSQVEPLPLWCATAAPAVEDFAPTAAGAA